VADFTGIAGSFAPEYAGLFDIRVLDHFIVGDGAPYSFSENGLL
jgi:DNA repair protein RadC